uniref:Uncharacterized protein n=1 Tax=Nelumbo nucifera TaxID=4432 RepID=A0A822Z7A0_NELNU|nr:TPA_asm: hypothetical protein HUJ06_014756 [Nelumbo nucifera]
MHSRSYVNLAETIKISHDFEKCFNQRKPVITPKIWYGRNLRADVLRIRLKVGDDVVGAWKLNVYFEFISERENTWFNMRRRKRA